MLVQSSLRRLTPGRLWLGRYWPLLSQSGCRLDLDCGLRLGYSLRLDQSWLGLLSCLRNSCRCREWCRLDAGFFNHSISFFTDTPFRAQIFLFNLRFLLLLNFDVFFLRPLDLKLHGVNLPKRLLELIKLLLALVELVE